MPPGGVTRPVRWAEAYRVSVYVPQDAVDAVLASVARVAELGYGAYRGVSWTSAAGTERFTPLDGATPAQGRIGAEERVASCKVEFSIPRDPALLARVVADGIRPAHPWEEPVVSVAEVRDLRG